MSVCPRGRCSRFQTAEVKEAAFPQLLCHTPLCVCVCVCVCRPSLKPVSSLLLSHKATVFTPRWRRQQPVFGHVGLFSWCRELVAAEAPPEILSTRSSDPTFPPAPPLTDPPDGSLWTAVPLTQPPIPVVTGISVHTSD